MRDLLLFVQFKKREKHSRRSVTFSALLKVTHLHECFSRFFNCTNGTKLRKTSQLVDKKNIFQHRFEKNLVTLGSIFGSLGLHSQKRGNFQ